MMHGGDYWQKKTDDAFGKSASKTIFDPNNAGIQNQTQSSAHSTAATKLKGDSGPVGKRSQKKVFGIIACLLYTSPSPRDATLSRMPSSA